MSSFFEEFLESEFCIGFKDNALFRTFPDIFHASYTHTHMCVQWKYSNKLSGEVTSPVPYVGN